MGNPFAAVAGWSANHPLVAILATLAVAAGLGAGMSQAEEGRINELFVPDDLPALQVQQDIEAIWGQTEGTFVLYIAADPTDPDLLRAVAHDMDRLRTVDGVIDARGLPTVLEARIGDLDKATDQQLKATAKQLQNSDAGKSFIASDALLVRVVLEPVKDIPATTAELDAVVAASSADADIRTAGAIYIEQMQSSDAGGDVGLLMPLSLAAVLVLLGVLFRRAQDVAVPVITVLISIVMAYGTVAWAGMALAPPSFIVMPLLLGLGIDYMLHIMYAYREQANHDSVPRRFTIAGQRVGHPVFYTALTTLIGFGSFLASNIPQIRTWGLLIGSGALYSFILGFVLLPALYRLRRRKHRTTRLPLENAMGHITKLVMNNRGAVLMLVLLATAGLGTAAAFVSVEESLDFEPDPDAPAVANFNAVQDRFGGQNLATFLVTGATLAQLRDFENALDADPLSGFVDGPSHRLQRAGTPNGPLVGPATEDVATPGHALVTVGYRRADLESAIDRFEEIAANSGLNAAITGPDVMEKESRAVFLPALFRSTMIALVLVIVLLAAVFRNPVTAALAFTPLVVTVVWQLGLQSLIDIPINPITGVMTAMILGVGVDYSLHIMAHFQEERHRGSSSRQAAEAAMRSVGRPVLAASITTVFAFSVLGFSSLLPLRHFGIVAAIVVTCAFIVSLSLLPVLASFLPDGRQAPTTRPSTPTMPTMPTGHTAPTKPAHVTTARGPASPSFTAPARMTQAAVRTFTVRPRFADPAVEAWHQDVLHHRRARINAHSEEP